MDKKISEKMISKMAINREMEGWQLEIKIYIFFIIPRKY